MRAVVVKSGLLNVIAKRVLVHDCQLSTWEAEAKGRGAPGHPCLHRVEDSLGNFMSHREKQTKLKVTE